MCHPMAGSETAVTYTEKLLRDVRMSPRGDGLSVIWMHIMPFYRSRLRIFLIIVRKCTSALVISSQMVFRRCMRKTRMRRWQKMVYCIYNGSVKQRIEEVERLARITEADGAVLFDPLGL